MMHGGCKCPHHLVGKLFSLLAGLAGLAFFWTSWKSPLLLGQDAGYYFASSIVLMIMSFSGKACGCCRWGMMKKDMTDGKCSHESGCTCGDCGTCK